MNHLRLWSVIVGVSALLATSAIAQVADQGGPDLRTTKTVVKVKVPTNSLGELDKYDTDHDHVVSAEEFEDAEDLMVSSLQLELLAYYHVSPDGTITAAQARAVHAELAYYYVTNHFASLHRSSTNSTHGEEKENLKSSKPTPFFMVSQNTRFDGISANEIAAAASSLAERLQFEFLEKYDDDEDGVVTMEESVEVHTAMAEDYFTELLLRFDLNKDGQVTPSEVAAALQGSRRSSKITD
ncbi:MAG: hypothetical protein JWM04_1795 [Verrucomicrobiales bacterium]|jgi:hypothetical protein|nr:hypothetical protein [Verrucomicrobiales bacterium]